MTTLLTKPSPAPEPPAEPNADTEAVLAGLLADVVGVERVSSDSHFFDDLGVDSLVMARFCARVRKREGLPPISVKDVYRYPTIASLATAVADAPGAPAEHEHAVAQPAPVPPAGRLSHLLCGALQLLAFVAYALGAALGIAAGYEWISAGSDPVDVYLRAAAFGGAALLAMSALPIVAKWTLAGRWKATEIRIWSLGYVRFWIVATLIRRNPMVLFAGSPLYVVYLRALGARIGRGAVVFSRNAPVCTDLLAIGEGAVIRKDSFFTCYRAEAGVIRTGPVTIGHNAFVGETTVLDIGTSLGDEAQLGHSSSLHEGQAVPDGERRRGSPARERTEVDHRGVAQGRPGGLRRVVYSGLQLVAAVGVAAPLAVGVVVALAATVPGLDELRSSLPADLASAAFYGNALIASLVVFAGAAVLGLAVVTTVPRLLNLAIRPDTTYALYGVRYALHRAIARLTNVPFFTYLFGDSSYIVNYLDWIGYDLSRVEQTGSNFGLEVKHETPFGASVGSGTMAADGLSIVNADFSSTSFRVSRAAIGRRSFLGNYVTYPSQSRAADNCLLATKVMVPVDGDVREGIGLLGSPSFEIPRSVQRDGRFDHLSRGAEFRKRLGAKNRHNVATMGLFLLTRWLHVFGLTVIGAGAIALYGSAGAAAIAGGLVLALPFTASYYALVERAASGFRALGPRFCSIYDPYFWWHERYWKLAVQPPRVLNGTPFKTLVWRALGVEIGKRVFDDGLRINEKTMVTVGDGCAFNPQTTIQPHSQEDGTFKSDRVAIGAGCTVGTGALIHYGATMGDEATLDPDSFLMKGAEVPADARWAMNPARELRPAHESWGSCEL